MFDPGSAGRIPETAFKACLGIFLGLSILATAARTVIRIRVHHQLYADDAFLYFGLVCMCTATGLIYSLISVFYLEEAEMLGPELHTLPFNDLPKLLEDMKTVDVFIVFAWTAEFSVKMSILLFFRRLVDRLPGLTRYLKIVMGFTTVVWAILICEPFMLCPHFGLAVISKSQCIATNVQPTVIAHTIFVNTLDILTDIMIISIPLCVVWKASMSIRQKLGIGVFLTMNIWLIIIALIRGTSYKQGRTYDLTWVEFFQFLEPNITILAACFASFRSIFVANRSKAREHGRPSHSLRQQIFRKTPSDHQLLGDLPTVPGATLIRERAALGNVSITNTISASNGNSDVNTLGGRSEGGFANCSRGIYVKHDWSLNSTRDGASGKQFV